MPCPICFFRESHQKVLKRNTFGTSRFENKLRAYKTSFIQGIRQLESLSDCVCYNAYNDPSLVTWTNSFLLALKYAEAEVQNAFDSIISVYEDYIGRSQKIAADRLWSYLQLHDLLRSTESTRLYKAAVQSSE